MFSGLYVASVVLAAIIGWFGQEWDRSQQSVRLLADTTSSFGTFRAAPSLPWYAASRARGPHRLVSSEDWGSFGTFGGLRASFGSCHPDQWQAQRATAPGAGEFVRRYLLLRGAAALRQRFDSS